MIAEGCREVRGVGTCWVRGGWGKGSEEGSVHLQTVSVRKYHDYTEGMEDREVWGCKV